MNKGGDLRVQQEHPEPFLLSGGDVGVLLIHGFSGTPREMRRVGDYLNEHGFTVSAPLLPGHGGTLLEMNRHHWREWVAAALTAYDHLKARCERIFVGGISMGSLISVWLATHRPDLAGVLFYSPALWVTDRRLALTGLFRHFIEDLSVHGESDMQDLEAEVWSGGFPHYPVPAAYQLFLLQRRTRPLLPQIHVPALVVYSQSDAMIHPRSGPDMVRRLGSSHVEVLVLEAAGHLITADRGWERVAEASHRFIAHYS